MPLARPDRMRFTLHDETVGSTPLELPARRIWPIGLVVAVFFAVFAAIDWMQIAKLSSQNVRGVSDLMFVLFEAFWVLGWSVGVIVLGALTVLLLYYRESVRIRDGRLIHVPQLGPLKVVCEYDLSRLHNLRLQTSDRENSVRIRFDYDGRTTGIGDWMQRSQAEALIESIRRSAPQTDAPPSAPDQAGQMLQQQPSTIITRTGELSRTGSPRGSTADLNAGNSRKWVSALVLIAANALPLIGVLLFGWTISNVMVLYWAESAVIAAYTVLKMFVVGKWVAPFAALFFVGHFGGFMAGHFLFVYEFFVRGVGAAGPEPAVREALLGIFGPLWPALLALVVSHGVSFVVNFMGAREYEGTTLSDLMSAPYKRVVVMHLTVILGGMLVLVMKTPLAALVLLVLLKTLADWRAHAGEHAQKLGGVVKAAANQLTP
ncbi:MAG: hypothetical protein JWN13_3193 [Betaproteobacteria bacterium]|nr:hypothetical protein [Betaproteobacteria bacterium]